MGDPMDQGEGVRYTVKELLAAQDKKLDTILQAVTNTVTGLDSVRETTVILKTRLGRSEEDVKDLRQTMYLAEQRRMEEMQDLRKTVGEVDTHQEVDDAVKTNRRWMIGILAACSSATISAIIALVKAFSHH